MAPPPSNLFSYTTQQAQERRIRELEKAVKALQEDGSGGSGTVSYPTLSAAQSANPPVGSSVYIVDEDEFYDVKAAGLKARVHSE